MERQVFQRQVWLVVPSPVHGHRYLLRFLGVVRGSRYECNSAHLFHSRRQSIVKYRILINAVENTRTVTPVPSDGPCRSRHP